ncbi:MAG TPA: TIGR02206 family membrane protein [Acidimicrobiales bacterium]
MNAAISPVSYWSSVVAAAMGCIVLCAAARRHPGRWTVLVARGIGLLLAADAVSYTVALVVQGTWSPKTSLPLALCNVGVVVAAVACWWRVALLVELTYFWGLAGTLQGIITPDLNVGFPHLVFFQYVAGHIGIVLAALFLVVGMRIEPRPGAVPRVFGITVGYTAVVGLVDALTGANYMFLREPPGEWTVLRLLGPWPWYLLSGTGVALVLFTLLDAPFWPGRRREAERAGPEGATPTGGTPAHPGTDPVPAAGAGRTAAPDREPSP